MEGGPYQRNLYHWLVVWNIFIFPIAGMMIQSDFQIFQRDWNHQLDQIGINEVHAVHER